MATASSPRVVHAPRGSTISCKGWIQEAAMRMLMNNLDPDVAEKPDELIVFHEDIHDIAEPHGPAIGDGHPMRVGIRDQRSVV